jgi:hypothetical protein
MKLVCAFCGFRNKIEAPICAKCGGSLTDAHHEKFHLPWASWVPAIPLAIFCYWEFTKELSGIASSESAHRINIAGIEARQQEGFRKSDEEFTRSQAEEEAKHQSRLRNEKLVSGQQAAERHALEWSQRQSHDPKYVTTLLERTMVEVERLGKDSALSAEVSLKTVAEMVCPPGSRIEVTPSGSRFVVRVAFRLSAVAPREAGTSTFLTSSDEMRRQIEEATARLMKDLFDYCGVRGIERVSVSCNRAITTGDPGQERLNMRSLYRASIEAKKASEVASWRQLSVAQVKKLMKVEHDMVSHLTIIQNGMPGLALDPNEPLEF